MARWSRSSWLVGCGLSAGVALLVACGPDPEAAGPKVPPKPAVSTTTVATTPKPPEPTVDDHKKAAKAAFDAGDYAKARPELEAVVAAKPDDVEAQQMLGDVYAALGDHPKATAAYFAATKADGGKTEMLALVAARALYDEQRFDDVISAAQASIKTNDKSMPLWMDVAMAQVAKADWASASDTYKTLTTAFPDEPELWGDLAIAYAAGGKKDDAKKAVKSGLDKWTEVRGPKSKLDTKLGKGPEELCRFSRALRLVGDNAGAWAALSKYTVPKDELAADLDAEKGFVKRAQKEAGPAKAQADKALKASQNNNAPAHLLLAALDVDGKKLDDAKSELSKYEALAGRDLTYALDHKDVQDAISSAAANAKDKDKDKAKDKPKDADKDKAAKKP